MVVTVEDPAILPLELARGDGAGDRIGDLLAGGPDVGEVDRLALGVRAQRVLREIEGDGARQGVRHAQRRGGKVRGPDLRMDTTFEVAVARQDGDHRKIPVGDCRRHLVGQGSRVADAGCAAVADEVEPELLEVGHQPGGVEVVGDHPGPGGHARLYPWLGLQPCLHRLPGQQAGGYHHRRVGCVGATRDRGDDHRAVVQGRRDRGCPTEAVAEDLGERRPHPGQRLEVLGPAGAGQAGLDRGEVEVEDVAEDGVGVLVGAEQALLLRVALDQVPQVTPPGLPQVVQ